MASGICHPTATQKKTPQKTPLPMASPPAATNPVEKSREPLALTQNAAARCASQAAGGQPDQRAVKQCQAIGTRRNCQDWRKKGQKKCSCQLGARGDPRVLDRVNDFFHIR